MLKPNLLREVLLTRVPQLKDHPERLTIVLEQGKVACTPAASLSFEYQYPLRITLSDPGGDIGALVVALLLRNTAFVLPGIFSDAFPAPSASQYAVHWTFPDGIKKAF